MKNKKKILFIGGLLIVCAIVFPNLVLSSEMDNAFKDGNTTYTIKEINTVCSRNIDANIAGYYNDNLIFSYDNNFTHNEEYYKYKDGVCSLLTAQEILAYKNDNITVRYELDENYNINKIVEKEVKNFLVSASGTTYDNTKNYFTCNESECEGVSSSRAEDVDDYFVMVIAKNPETAVIDINEEYYEVTQYINQNTSIISKVNSPIADNADKYYKIVNPEDIVSTTKIGEIDETIFEPIFNNNFGYLVSNGTDSFIAVDDYESGETTYYDLNGDIITSINQEGKRVASVTYWDNSLIVAIYFDKTTESYSHTSFLNSDYEEIFRSDEFDAIFEASYDEDKSSIIFGNNNYQTNDIKYYTLNSFNEKSNKFKSILNENGNLVIKSVPPQREDDSQYILNEYVPMTYSNDDRFVGVVECNDDYTECAILLSDEIWGDEGETHIVPIKYEYNSNIKTTFEGYIDSIPEDLRYFSINDMELMNYWVNGKGDISNLINYSSELKSYFDYKNFDIDLRQGGFEDFHTFASGIANFVYNNTIYGIRDNTGVEAYHIMYVPDNTESTKEALRTAVQKRVDAYFGEDKVEIISGEKSIIDYENDYYDDMIEYYQELLDIEEAKPVENQDYFKLSEYRSGVENYTTYKEYFMDSYNSSDGENYFLNEAEGNWYFIAKIDDIEYLFVVMKDSDKMVTPKLITSDIETDITISSTGNLPLDTLINANELTSGSEYDKIIDLTSEEGRVFDLRLYSNSIEKYITKLDDNSFEVKIPIPEEFEGKTLIIYYVDENDKTIEYEVKPKDGYATFITDHFSIYTLAIKNVDENSPKTGDSIINSIVLGIISLFSLLGVSLYLKKKRFN